MKNNPKPQTQSSPLRPDIACKAWADFSAAREYLTGDAFRPISLIGGFDFPFNLKSQPYQKEEVYE